MHFILTVRLILLLLHGLTSIAPYQSSSLVYDIIEESEPNSTIADIKIDAHLSNIYDEEILNSLRFVFLKQSQNQRQKYFKIDHFTGLISRSEVRLDREKDCPKAIDCIFYIDVAIQPPNFQIIKISFHVLDLNDNGPKFKRNYINVSLPENTGIGTFLSIPLAEDWDSPRNGIKGYKIDTRSQKFSLEVEADDRELIFRVGLVLCEKLDREMEDSHEIYVIVYDGGYPSLTGSLTINLLVEDINDNQPQFETISYELDLQENAPPTKSLIQMKARDIDLGTNGRVRYNFSERTISQYGHQFHIDAETGIITLIRSLDFELQSRIVLEILAHEDGFEETYPARARVTVNVKDINDNFPIIVFDRLELENQSDYKTDEHDTVLSIIEHSPPETFVAQMAVVDSDSGSTESVRCSLVQQNQSTEFNLKATGDGEYRLVTAAEIDREVTSEFQLQIHCCDFGNPPLNTTKYFTIIIKDLNDNSPKFAQEIYNIRITENSEVQQEILRVEAKDPDDGDNGKIYYALQPEVDSIFEIDKSSGSIWTTSSLDRENNNFHTLLVIAKDGGQPNSKISTATVVVTVVDTNDEVPYFLRSDYVFSLYENQPPKAVIGQVKAIDRDLFPYNRHSFYIDTSKSNFPIGLFKIDSRTGMIVTKQYLNREEREMYNMTVVVKDDEYPAFQTTTEVIIKVLDVNDNSPLLLFPVSGNESIYAPVTAAKGYYLGTIRAYDPDSEENARLIFTFKEGEDLDSFDLNSQTGDITVRSDLSKLDSQIVQITILVEDSGTPKKSISANLRVYIGYNSLLPYYPPTSSKADTQLVIIIVFVSGTLILTFALTIVSCFVCHHRLNATKELHLASSCGVIAHDNRKPICLHGVGEIIGETDPDCNSNKSWKIASATAEDEATLDGYVVVNKNLMNDTASLATAFDRRSLQHSTNSDMMSQCPYNDTRVVAAENGMGQMYLPQLTDFNNCCKYISYRPTYCISDSSIGEFPVFPCRSPVWKLPHPIHQRLPSFSDWLNSESSQLQQQGHRPTHNVNHMNHVTDNGPTTHSP